MLFGDTSTEEEGEACERHERCGLIGVLEVTDHRVNLAERCGRRLMVAIRFEKIGEAQHGERLLYKDDLSVNHQSRIAHEEQIRRRSGTVTHDGDGRDEAPKKRSRQHDVQESQAEQAQSACDETDLQDVSSRNDIR